MRLLLRYLLAVVCQSFLTLSLLKIFFVFELGVEYVLASVQYSYKSRQQTLRTSTKLMSTQHTASFVVAVKELVNEYIMSGPYVILSYLEALSSSDCDTQNDTRQ